MEAILLFIMSLFLREENATKDLWYETQKSQTFIQSNRARTIASITNEMHFERTAATKLITWHLAGIKYARDKLLLPDGTMSHTTQKDYLPLGLSISGLTSIKKEGRIFTFGDHDALLGIAYSGDFLNHSEKKLGWTGHISEQKWPAGITIINLNNNHVIRGPNYITPPSFPLREIVLVTEIG